MVSSPVRNKELQPRAPAWQRGVPREARKQVKSGTEPTTGDVSRRATQHAPPRHAPPRSRRRKPIDLFPRQLAASMWHANAAATSQDTPPHYLQPLRACHPTTPQGTLPHPADRRPTWAVSWRVLAGALLPSQVPAHVNENPAFKISLACHPCRCDWHKPQRIHNAERPLTPSGATLSSIRASRLVSLPFVSLLCPQMLAYHHTRTHVQAAQPRSRGLYGCGTGRYRCGTGAVRVLYG